MLSLGGVDPLDRCFPNVLGVLEDSSVSGSLVVRQASVRFARQLLVARLVEVSILFFKM